MADTGSAVSLITQKSLNHQAQVTPYHVPVKALTNTPIPIQGICKITLYRNTCGKDEPICCHQFLVTSQTMPQFDGILGNDWFTKNNAVIDYNNNSIQVHNFCIPFHLKIPTPIISSLIISSPTDSIYQSQVSVQESAGSLIPAEASKGPSVVLGDGQGVEDLQGLSTHDACSDNDEAEGEMVVEPLVSSIESAHEFNGDSLLGSDYARSRLFHVVGIEGFVSRIQF